MEISGLCSESMLMGTCRLHFYRSFRHYLYGCVSILVLYFIYLHFLYQNERRKAQLYGLNEESDEALHPGGDFGVKLDRLSNLDKEFERRFRERKRPIGFGQNKIDEVEKQLEEEPSANKVLATFYIEAQCGDTTRFVHDQLWPSWQKLYDTNQIIWRVVPFGKAQCYSQPDNDYKCECQHGEDECELNQLMNCVIKHVRRIDQYMPFINCIQGKSNILEARKHCLDGRHHSVTSLLDCASGKEGRRLLSEAGELTKQIDLTFVPWIELNGKRSVDAMYALHENLCNLMPNKPKQCFNN